MNNLGVVYYAEGNAGRAEALHQKVLEARILVLGPENPRTLGSMTNLAVDYESEGKYAQAEALDQKVLDIQRRVLGAENPATLALMANLASIYEDEGKDAQAAALIQQGLKMAPNNVSLLTQDAWLLSTAKDHRGRRPREALEAARRAVSLAPEEVDLLDTLGLAEVRNGFWDEAIATLNKSIAAKNGSQLYDFLF